MFSNKFIIVLCVVVIVKAYDDLRILDSIRLEYPCSARGGLCTIAADCPKGHLVQQKGLCPEQRAMGVECCYGVSVKETRCQKRGGECFPGPEPCKKMLVDENATDCPKDSVCCTLTH